MNELKKIDNVIKKFDTTQPCESLLVIDATTGQSGIIQAKAFNEVTKLTGIILTKMDGTSKGGIILSIKDAFNLPVKYIGLGETIDDLQEFDLEFFIHGLTSSLNLESK
jgi:fused signal recognition particle receptor